VAANQNKVLSKKETSDIVDASLHKNCVLEVKFRRSHPVQCEDAILVFPKVQPFKQTNKQEIVHIKD
jgi:hypothetical protein